MTQDLLNAANIISEDISRKRTIINVLKKAIGELNQVSDKSILIDVSDNLTDIAVRLTSGSYLVFITKEYERLISELEKIEIAFKDLK